MRKMTILTLFITLFTLHLKAPENRCLYIAEAEGINYYEPLIKAIVQVESKNGQYLYNPKEGAVGYFQIRQCRLDDYNKKTGSHYKLQDCYDYELSRRIFLYYSHGKNYEKAARDWNGSGYKTITYWNKVKMYLN